MNSAPHDRSGRCTQHPANCVQHIVVDHTAPHVRTEGPSALRHLGRRLRRTIEPLGDRAVRRELRADPVASTSDRRTFARPFKRSAAHEAFHIARLTVWCRCVNGAVATPTHARRISTAVNYIDHCDVGPCRSVNRCVGGSFGFAVQLPRTSDQ